MVPGVGVSDFARRVRGRATRSAAGRSRASHSRSDSDYASRRLAAGTAALAFSVVADSALEHYRGGFYNPVMYAGPTVSALTLATAVTGVVRPRTASRARDAVFGAAAVAGLVGLGFHIRNVAKREGGLSWNALFYGAPVAAPLGIHLAGLFGLAADRVAAGDTRLAAGGERRLPRALAALSAAGLLGTAAEAGLLHFRGAFQDPFMYLPVTLPPLAAGALILAALHPGEFRRGLARGLLRATAAAGLAGMGFHALGVHRNMGGWRNWRQNLLVGPPLPAPPSFTGLALAGLGSLSLLPAR